MGVLTRASTVKTKFLGVFVTIRPFKYNHLQAP